MVLWGLCGDIINGRVVTASPQAGTTALRKVFEDLDYRFTYINNVIGHPAPQLPSLEVFLDVPMDDFTQKISGQHYIIAYGDHGQILKDFCYLKDIDII
jgi:hypothetical protein